MQGAIVGYKMRNASLSARRAWIEITLVQIIISGYAVALRKESVDRNHAADISTRREANVALRKESVDRNFRHKV